MNWPDSTTQKRRPRRARPQQWHAVGNDSSILDEACVRDDCIYEQFAAVAAGMLRWNDRAASPVRHLGHVRSAQAATLNRNRLMKRRVTTTTAPPQSGATAAQNGPSKVKPRAKKTAKTPYEADFARQRSPVNAHSADADRTAHSPQFTGASGGITVEAVVDVGFGNQVFIRGVGAGLSWDKGIPLECRHPSTWIWSSPEIADKVVFKLLLNDTVWSLGEDHVAEAGKPVRVTPLFPTG